MTPQKSGDTKSGEGRRSTTPKILLPFRTQNRSSLLLIPLAIALISVALIQFPAAMKIGTSLKLLLGLGLANRKSVHVAGQFNNPPGVDIWCGKSYRPENASFNPGGWLVEPSRSSSPLLNLKLYPRMNLYLADDRKGSFIIDAALSYTNGFPWSDEGCSIENLVPSPPRSLSVTVSIVSSGMELISREIVRIGTESNEFTFSLENITPRYERYSVVLNAVSVRNGQSFSTSTEMYLLPNRKDPGSVTKLDNLYGGLHVQNYLNSSSLWEPLLPYSYYVSWGGWLKNSLDYLNVFQSEGYNIIHVIPTFELDLFEEFFKRCDELGLWVMYDMRHTYKNATAVTEQVNLFKNHKSLLLWYTGDEPDGVGDPLNATKESYDLIKSLDPYHPISLCLNCYNFYYGEYSTGADIILSDVYPIATNTSYSTVYDTVCNTTYGCCGCDDCKGNFNDISERLDIFTQYQSWLGRSPKSLWGVPQAFGSSQFWVRNPTGEEEVVMAMLSINHNAKGIVAWTYPTEATIMNATSALAKAVTAPNISRLILGAKTVPLVVEVPSQVDVASWTIGKQILVSLVNLEYTGYAGPVSVHLPSSAAGILQVVRGSSSWEVKNDKLVKKDLSSLEVGLILVELE